MKYLPLVAVLLAGPATAQGFTPGYGIPSPFPTPAPAMGFTPALPFGTGSNPSSHGVQGYENREGTYVPPHYQTNPNGTQLDNYNTRGNVNPYTGAVGTRPPRW